MNWLARLKKAGGTPAGSLQNLQNPPFVGFVETRPGPFPEIQVKDPVCMARVDWCADHGLDLEQAQAVGARLKVRDLEQDERRLCLECRHLYGTPEARRCRQWSRLGLVGGPAIPGELVLLLQRCPGFLPRGEEGP